MHHVIVERWSRGASWLHARDARAKLIAALALILAVASTPAHGHTAALSYALLLILASAAARLPVISLGARAALVLPFSAALAAASWLAGDTTRAAALLWKSYLSAFTVLLLVSATPLIALLRALEWARVPGLLILIAQFLYRYLFVISEQAQHMRVAAACRGAGSSPWTFRGAAAALSVLFIRSYARAEGIQRSMIARGFTGHFPATAQTRPGVMDWAFGALSLAACACARVFA
jgi:cobalt/nickel transport system permease protein